MITRRSEASRATASRTGIGLTPTFVWATTDATPRLFAFIFPGYLQLVEDGWQSNAAALEQRQKLAEGEAGPDEKTRPLVTALGQVVGTAPYMSPEQLRDEELDARSDVYSLGAMLYEMLTGDPPYTGSTAQAIVAKVITEKAPPVTATD